jgi:hypothetical protein
LINKLSFVTKLVSIAIFSILFIGCEKNITITPQNAEPVLVVEAEIENDAYPTVLLSRSQDYFSKIDAQTLANSFVSNAIVTISNGTLTHQLKEYIIPVSAIYSIKIYTIDTNNLGTAFKGELNKSYTLSIVAQGKQYSAVTKIPSITRRIDSLWYIDAPVTDSNWKKIMVKAFDPAGLGDYIRYFTKRNKENFFPGNPSVFDDAFIDGTSYELQVDRGRDRNNPSTEPDESRGLFKRGDTMILKTCNIDKATYDFWRTMEYTYQSIGNPFSSPIKVLSNINGAPALGYFGGYAAQYRTLIIPK